MCQRKAGAVMAEVALGLVEQNHPALLLGSEAGGEPLRIAGQIEGGLVRDQRAFVQLNCQPEEEGEIRLHHRIGGGIRIEAAEDALSVPVARGKAFANQVLIAGVEALSRGITQGGEDAVLRMDALACQRLLAQQLARQFREGSAQAGHFPIINRWGHRLRGQ